VDTIYESGFPAATVTAVARRARLTTGAFQHHFPSRSDLLVELIDAMRERAEAEMRNIAVPGKTIPERVEAIATLYWNIFSGRHYIAAVQIQLGTMNDARLFALIARAIQQTEKALDRSWTAAFADLPLPKDRLTAARYVMLAAIRGMVIRQRHPRKKASWEQERALLIEMVSAALAHSPR
jgi:AcrR family transcriptional regulator